MPNNFDYSLAVTKFNANEIRLLNLSKDELRRDKERLREMQDEIQAKLWGLEIIEATYKKGYGIGDRVMMDGKEFLVDGFLGGFFKGTEKLKSGNWSKRWNHIFEGKLIKEEKQIFQSK